MIRFLMRLGIVYVFSLVSLQSLNPSFAGSARGLIPPSEAVSNQVLNLISSKVMIDSQVTDQVSKIGYGLLRDYDSSKISNYRFHVFHHSAPNAFSLPSGDIFVTTGLLDLVESKDELAIVLGREIAFLEEDIGWRFFRGEEAKTTMVTVAEIALYGVVMYFQVSAILKAAEEDPYRTSSSPTYTVLYTLIPPIPKMILNMNRNARLRKAQLPPALMMGREKSPTSFDMFLVKNISEGFGETVELAGDRRSLSLATKAGWNSEALVSLLEKLVPSDPSRMLHLRSWLGKRMIQAEKEILEIETPVGSKSTE